MDYLPFLFSHFDSLPAPKKTDRCTFYRYNHPFSHILLSYIIPRKHILQVPPYILFPRSQSVPEPVLRSRTELHRLYVSIVN